MDIKQRLELIKRRTAEIVKEEELDALLKEDPHPHAYIGIAVTGRVHIGYFVPMMKIMDFLKAGLKVTILLADIHAHLDDQKTPFDLLEKRVKYYKKAMSTILDAIGADSKKVKFVKGSDFQLSKNYTIDMYRLAALNTFDRTKRAAAGVVRFGDNPKLSGFIYPILQALDEQYLDADIQLGGIDQRKILMFARENLPRLNYKARIEIMTPMLPGLTGDKMSASIEKSKIDILENKEAIIKKVDSFYCPEGEVVNNGVLAFTKHILFPLNKCPVTIPRPKKFGGNISYDTYEQLEADFAKKSLHPMDLKKWVAEKLEERISIIRKRFKGKEKLVKDAFP